MNLKSIALLLSTCLILLLVASCKREIKWDDIPTTSGPAGKAGVFTSGITGAAFSRLSATGWQPADIIGVSMRKLQDSAVIEANKKYIPSADGRFKADAEGLISYPTDGTLVNFVAYYPYQATANPVYKIDVTAQHNPASIDFMYAVNATNFNTNSKTTPHLQFERQLAKLVLNIKAAPGVPDIRGLQVKFKDFPVKADFNLQSATLGITETGDIAAVVESADTVQTASLLAIPSGATGKIVEIKLASGKIYEWAIPSGANLVKGSISTFNILLQPPVEQQLFFETCGAVNVTVATPVATHNRWDNPNLIFSDSTGRSAIRLNAAMNGNHILFTGRSHFKIDKINTKNATNLKLSFSVAFTGATVATPINLNTLKMMYNGLPYELPNIMFTNTNRQTVEIDLSGAVLSDAGTLEFGNDTGTGSYPGIRLDDFRLSGTR